LCGSLNRAKEPLQNVRCHMNPGPGGESALQSAALGSEIGIRRGGGIRECSVEKLLPSTREKRREVKKAASGGRKNLNAGYQFHRGGQGQENLVARGKKRRARMKGGKIRKPQWGKD